MDIKLQDLIDAAQAAPEGTTPADAVAAFLADKPGVDVAKLQAEAVAQFEALQESGKVDSDAFAALEAFVAVAEGASAELARRDDEAQAASDKIAELAKRIKPTAEKSDDTDKADAEPTGADKPADPEAADTPAEKPAADAAPAPVAADLAPAAPVADAPAAVAASARRTPPRRINVADLPRKTEPKRANVPAITAAADVSGFAPGQALDFDQVARAAGTKFESFPRGFQPNMEIRAGIARVAIPFPRELVADGRNDQDVLDYAGDTARLNGKSLAASGGWCAPSETLYDLGPTLMEANVGLLDIAEIQAPRGGIRYTEGPDYAALWGNIGWGQTEAQAIAGVNFIDPQGTTVTANPATKPCYRVPCPSFVEARSEVWGFCISNGLLANDAYPEATRDLIEKALVVHAHRINARTIKRVVDQSGAAIVANFGPSATASLLNTLDAQITDYRYRNRMSASAELDVVLPLWLKAVIRSDQAVRNNSMISEAYDVTDQKIDAWFRARSARVQWVIDWQDAFSGVSGGFGSATAIASWPDTVDALIYAAGTFVRARGEVISLDAIYDTVNLAANDYQAIWVEEKLLVVKRRYNARLVRIALAANGATGIARELDADGKIVVTP